MREYFVILARTRSFEPKREKNTIFDKVIIRFERIRNVAGLKLYSVKNRRLERPSLRLSFEENRMSLSPSIAKLS